MGWAVSTTGKLFQLGHLPLLTLLFRRSAYPKPRYTSHPQDCSVMTYRGHSVLRTLIRCHFSPFETTGGQYIYSGSADGKVHVRPYSSSFTRKFSFIHTF